MQKNTCDSCGAALHSGDLHENTCHVCGGDIHTAEVEQVEVTQEQINAIKY